MPVASVMSTEYENKKTRLNIKEWLSYQDAYTLHKHNKRNVRVVMVQVCTSIHTFSRQLISSIRFKLLLNSTDGRRSDGSCLLLLLLTLF